MFADEIQQRREHLGMTQEDFARHMRVTQQTVSRWENGVVVPDLNKVRYIAEVLDMDANYLLPLIAQAAIDARAEPKTHQAQNDLAKKVSSLEQSLAGIEARLDELIGAVLGGQAIPNPPTIPAPAPATPATPRRTRRPRRPPANS